MGLTLKTMGANPTLDWLIFSDQAPPVDLPSNIRFFPDQLQNLAHRIEKVAGTKVSIARPYDLCIFRPCYGQVFAEHLRSYDFWGHCDLDVLWGDLRSFITEEILEKYDRVLIRGHLSLYLNTPQINAAYKLPIPGGLDFHVAFASPSSSQFDEWKGINLIFRYHNLKQFHANWIADILPPSRFVVPAFRTVSQPNFPDQIFYWYRGKVFRAFLYEGGVWDEEFAYIHFQRRRFPPPPSGLLDLDSFGIGPCGFFQYQREPLHVDAFRALNRGFPKPLYEILQIVSRGIRRRLGFEKTSNAYGEKRSF